MNDSNTWGPTHAQISMRLNCSFTPFLKCTKVKKQEGHVRKIFFSENAVIHRYTIAPECDKSIQ